MQLSATNYDRELFESSWIVSQLTVERGNKEGTSRSIYKKASGDSQSPIEVCKLLPEGNVEIENAAEKNCIWSFWLDSDKDTSD